MRGDISFEVWVEGEGDMKQYYIIIRTRLQSRPCLACCRAHLARVPGMGSRGHCPPRSCRHISDTTCGLWRGALSRDTPWCMSPAASLGPAPPTLLQPTSIRLHG